MIIYRSRLTLESSSKDDVNKSSREKHTTDYSDDRALLISCVSVTLLQLTLLQHLLQTPDDDAWRYCAVAILTLAIILQLAAAASASYTALLRNSCNEQEVNESCIAGCCGCVTGFSVKLDDTDLKETLGIQDDGHKGVNCEQCTIYDGRTFEFKSDCEQKTLIAFTLRRDVIERELQSLTRQVKAARAELNQWECGNRLGSDANDDVILEIIKQRLVEAEQTRLRLMEQRRRLDEAKLQRDDMQHYVTELRMWKTKQRLKVCHCLTNLLFFVVLVLNTLIIGFCIANSLSTKHEQN